MMTPGTGSVCIAGCPQATCSCQNSTVESRSGSRCICPHVLEAFSSHRVTQLGCSRNGEQQNKQVRSVSGFYMRGFFISGINKEFILLWRTTAENWDHMCVLLNSGPVAAQKEEAGASAW